jgi:hypothetical protein
MILIFLHVLAGHVYTPWSYGLWLAMERSWIRGNHACTGADFTYMVDRLSHYPTSPWSSNDQSHCAWSLLSWWIGLLALSIAALLSYIHIYGVFFLHAHVVTFIFNKLYCVCVHTNLSVRVCLYAQFKILKLLLREIFW